MYDKIRCIRERQAPLLLSPNFGYFYGNSISAFVSQNNECFGFDFTGKKVSSHCPPDPAHHQNHKWSVPQSCDEKEVKNNMDGKSTHTSMLRTYAHTNTHTCRPAQERHVCLGEIKCLVEAQIHDIQSREHATIKPILLLQAILADEISPPLKVEILFAVCVCVRERK